MRHRGRWAGQGAARAPGPLVDWAEQLNLEAPPLGSVGACLPHAVQPSLCPLQFCASCLPYPGSVRGQGRLPACLCCSVSGSTALSVRFRGLEGLGEHSWTQVGPTQRGRGSACALCWEGYPGPRDTKPLPSAPESSRGLTHRVGRSPVVPIFPTAWYPPS